METIIIQRQYLEDRTIGDLYFNNLWYCNTLELPDLNNQRLISCIPEGVYYGTPEKHSKKGYVIRIQGVKNRSGILIHIGNDICDTQGCILVGKIDCLSSQRLIKSRIAMNKLYNKIANAKKVKIIIDKQQDFLIKPSKICSNNF